MENIITLRNVTKKAEFTQDVKVDFLEDINITFKKGKYVALTGKRGSGKSTLLGIILGYEKKYIGIVEVLDRHIGEMNEYELEKFREENIGICLTDKSPVDLELTVRDNLRKRLVFWKEQSVEQRANEMISKFELTGLQNIKAQSCSATDLYRLQLALSFCGYPPIIIIDETLDYFGAEERTKLFATIRSLQRENDITMIIVTQEVDLILQADRAINIMNETTYEVDLLKLQELIDKKHSV